MFVYIVVFASIILSFIFFQISWRYNKDTPITNWPIIGMLPGFLQNSSNIFDYFTLVLKHYGGTLAFEGPWFSNTKYLVTSDPMNVHQIVSKKFGNYGKGTDFNEIFYGFGGGIFNSDFHAWEEARTTLHSLFKRKSFMIFLQQTIQKKMENFLIPFLDHASKEGVELDIQDALERFAFDAICSITLGYDPNCLPNKLAKVSRVAYEKDLTETAHVVFLRHFRPRWLWKLQRWLHIGPEKRFKEAIDNLDKLLNERITCKREEQNRRNSSKKVDDTHSDLIGVLMEEAALKGQVMDDKYLRDTTFSLLSAGSVTVSTSLSWFFWLVSTHPHVEAKILQEIKDNCLNQDGNIIDSSLEELGKLVYLHGAICEALRLFPSVPFNHKCAIESDILPSGHHVSPNTKILYSLYSMGRMEQIWGNDVVEFKPERWISERGRVIHVPSYKFIAFNAGPRSCLGKDIALIEMKMVAVAILWRFHMQVVEGHPITPRMSILLTMKHGLKVKLTERCV